MPKETLNIALTESELKTVISGLLFSCSVNVTSNTNEEYQRELLEVAKKLKNYKTDIKLDDIQFLKEDNYEDVISVELFHEFQNNLEVTSFEHI
jgi:cyclopropane fatty-acyl-phospholipid synthase-like methyltransferase